MHLHVAGLYALSVPNLETQTGNCAHQTLDLHRQFLVTDNGRYHVHVFADSCWCSWTEAYFEIHFTCCSRPSAPVSCDVSPCLNEVYLTYHVRPMDRVSFLVMTAPVCIHWLNPVSYMSVWRLLYSTFIIDQTCQGLSLGIRMNQIIRINTEISRQNSTNICWLHMEHGFAYCWSF